MADRTGATGYAACTCNAPEGSRFPHQHATLCPEFAGRELSRHLLTELLTRDDLRSATGTTPWRSWRCSCGVVGSGYRWSTDIDLANEWGEHVAREAVRDASPEQCPWTLTDIYGVPWVCTLPQHDPGPGSLHNPVPVTTPARDLS